MSKLTFVSATVSEIKPLLQHLQNNGRQDQHLQARFNTEQHEIDVLITGIGGIQMAANLALYVANHSNRLYVHTGISGAYNRRLQLGDVVLVQSERFGDLGIEESDGSFQSIFNTDLMAPNQPPFRDGKLVNPTPIEEEFLPIVNGLTVQTVTGTEKRLNQLLHDYEADVESMEGAAFFYVCLQSQLPFLSIRGISNYVEKRNRSNWEVDLAVKQLNQDLIELMRMIS